MTLVWLCLVGAPACASGTDGDLGGRWVFHMDPDFRGNAATVECVVRQDARRVFVTCGSGQEMKGNLHGPTLTFETPETASGARAVFTATVHPGMAALEGKWHVTLTGATKEGRFAAKKQDVSPRGD